MTNLPVADVELLSKLQQEIKYEADEANSAPDAPESVSEFMSQGVWKVRWNTNIPFLRIQTFSYVG